VVDVPATTEFLSSGLTNVLSLLPVVGGLGTAAMGIVDSTKVFWGGPSNFGFGYVENGVKPFLIPKDNQTAVFKGPQVLQTLRANWLNGVTKPDQKAIAKALIHLGLTEDSAPALAKAAGVDAVKLTTLAEKVKSGGVPDNTEVSVLGQFDVILSAVLDTAYERGDQKYRNACKILALGISTVLSVMAGSFLYGTYFDLRHFGISLLVGLSATPLAPVAKDLATSLQAAVAAIRTVKR
jgi:hypothetical protein